MVIQLPVSYASDNNVSLAGQPGTTAARIRHSTGQPARRLRTATVVGKLLQLFAMTAIPARDLRNHTAEVLRRVEAGEEIEVLRDNRPVAKIIPLSWRRRWLPAAEIAQALARLGPDSTGLARELRETLTETTDDLRW